MEQKEYTQVGPVLLSAQRDNGFKTIYREQLSLVETATIAVRGERIIALYKEGVQTSRDFST
jgi:hypothetical protein